MVETVSVIGLGAMGAALARTQLAAGARTTVWNRTAARAAPLVAEGAVAAASAAEAARASEVVLVCLDACASAEAALGEAWRDGALAGRVVAQLGTTTPDEARRFADLVRGAGGLALDGAIMCYPDAVGPENDAPLLIGGDAEGRRIAEPALRRISRNLIDLGDNIAAAAALDLGLLTTSLSLYAGIAHAARLCEAEGADVGLLARLCLHGPRAPERFEIIARDAFALNSLHGGASLGVWADVAGHVDAHARGAGINGELPALLARLYRGAAEAGHGDEDVAALVKLLRR